MTRGAKERVLDQRDKRENSIVDMISHSLFPSGLTTAPSATSRLPADPFTKSLIFGRIYLTVVARMSPW